MSQISLQSALDRVNATLQRERQAGHDDLRRILRQSRHNPQAIAEVQLQHGQDLFEALAGIVETERLAYLKSFKSTTKSATSTTSSRLAAASASYRFAIEVCGKSILWSKAKECLIHLTESFSDDQNGICEPIALDNVKAINEILSHQPHLDHVPTKLWKLLCKFAVSHLDQQCSSSTRTTNGSSSARTNSNSSLTQSQSSQIRRLNSSTQKHLSAEFARMVRYLTATTSVPVYAVADLLTGSLLRSLRQASIPGSPEVDLLMALNHVLIRSDTEVTQMLKLRTPDLIQTIEQLWVRLPARLTALKDELLNSLVLLLPFIKAALNSETADNTQDFRQQIQSILDSLLQDYSGRSQKDLLSFDDVRLVVTSNASAFDQSTLSLSSDNDEAYRNWSMLLLAAHLLNNLYPEDQPVNSGTEDLRSQKRLRKESRSYTLIRMSRDPSPTKSQAGLQLIAMYCQVGGLNEEEIQDVVLYLKQLLNDEKPTIAAWASVALASCACQRNAASPLLRSTWSEIWSLSMRAIGASASCRVSCHLLSTLHTYQLIDAKEMSIMVSSMRDNLDLHGPATCEDSVLGFINIMLHFTQSSRPAVFDDLAAAAIEWFFRTWDPGSHEVDDARHLPPNMVLGDVISLLSACLSNAGLEVQAWPKRANDLSRHWDHQEAVQPVLSYLLLSPSVSYRGSSLHPAPAETDEKNKTRNSSIMDQLAQHCKRHLSRKVEFWADQASQKSTSIRASDVGTTALLLRLCQWTNAASLHDSESSMDDSGKVMSAISRHIATADCHPTKVEAFLRTFLATIYKLDRVSGNKSIMLMESKWYSQIYGVLPTIDIADMSQSNLDDDDLNGGDDSDFESAPRKPANGATRQASQSTSISTAKDIASAACGRLYTKLLSGLAEKDERPLEPFMDELQSMTSDEKVAGRDIIIRMKEFGAELDEKSAFDILDHLCEEVLQQSYAQSHSGIAKAFVIRFWAASFDQWIFATDRKLQDVSVDIYDDCLRSLTEHDLDIEAQTILSDVLVKMWQQNENFAQNDMFAQDDTGPPSSPRTAVIQIISEGCTLAKHHLTSKMPAVFSCYSMSVHDALYDDLEKSLPNDADSTDAIAMRIEFLASLGSQWKSLLRRVVWHIFDAAGQVPACVGHAAQAVRKICNSHGFKDGPSLFRLFCTQLTYTWQTERSLSDVPFTIFEYDSLHDLIQDNQEELVAQSHLFNKTGDLDMIKETLQMDLADLIRASFVTTFTYAMAHDVSQTPQSQSLANHESTLREHLNKDEVISLFRQHLPQLIAKSIISTHVDGSIERALEKRSHMDNARQALAAMKGFASDAREPPPALQPSFKIRHFFDFLERLARRVGRKSQDLFSGPLFVSTLRTVLDSLDDCLGSLHARTIVLKIRLLCALGEKALDLRYAIEVLVRNLRPLLDDQNCADDAAGIMHHLFTRARKCIPQASENLSGIVCQAILTVDLLRRGMIRPSTLLNSQSQTTKSNMHKLSTWLIEYVASLDCDIHDRHKATFQGISSTFGEIQYPAEFRRDSKASHYLLALLDDTKASRPFMDEGDRFVLIRCLIENSAGAPLGDDVFQKHSAASRYATSAWRATKKLRLPEAVSEWLGRALGRSYSLSGPAQARRMLPVDESEIYARPKNFSQAIQASRLAILRKLLEFISDGDTAQASVAERALRTIISAFASADDLESVQSLLPEHVFAALNMSATTSKGSRSKHPKAGHPFANGNALSKHGAYSINSLAQQAVSSMPSEPTAEPLLSVVGTVDDFAESIIGPLWHLGLCVVEYEGQSARKSFSETASLAFQQDASSDLAKHIILVLMYLLRQPVEKEGTRVERLEWLDVDYITAARIAMSCGMPKHALLLVEIAPRVVQQNRSSRRSSSQAATGHADIPHDLLLTIFDSIDDPDSFYAVARAPSFDNILKRVDREANPLKSLVLHSAYMDASKRAGVGADMVHNSNALTAISNMNLNTMTQILLEHSREDGIDAPETAMTMSRKLYEWDIQITDAKSTPQSILFGAFQQLSNVPNASAFQNSLGAPLSQSLRILADADLTRDTATSALHALTVLSDMQSLTDCTSASNAFALQSELTSLQSSWDVGQYAELIDLVSNRESLFGTLRRNTALLADLRISVRDGYLLEAQSVLQTAEASRDLGGKQGSLGAATYINRLVEQCKEQGLQIEVAAVRELASVLWIQDEPEVSIQMLQSLVSAEHSKQDISVDRASLLSQLGHEIAEARLEKPGDIIDKYLKPALHSLNKSSTYQDAANVYFEFASFCDQQLQNPDNEEEFKNLIALKASKEKEQEELRKLDKTVSDKNDKIEVRRRYNKAKQWYELDNQEYLRMLRVRNELVTQALSNYLRALAASEKHDSYVVRFFALWLDHDDSDEAQSAVAQCLKDVPSWKFVTLLNQIMSRLQATEEKFQRLLAGLVGRICGEHPYHSIYHLFASVNVKVGPNDSAAKLRKQAAEKIAHDLKSSKKTGELVSNVWAANSLYHNLAGAKVDTGRAMKFSIQQVPAAKEMNKRIPPMHIPPATLHLKIRPRADYRDVPYIARFREELSIASGLSAPKVLTARSSDGKDYKMLFKGGNDDLRQDAIMEQVFSSVSSMLRNHTDTRRRNLHIRTYVVLPLTHTSGIIEFVPNSLPLHDFVVPAHQRYHPTDMHPDQARSAIKKVQESNRETRIKTYQNVTSKYSPVLRHFFFERFETPQVWFEKRTAYARSTAAISILGHVLGLGDRHCHNILLDELSGEVIHIDLGVAFEMGRVLPVPEVVPFRLTRDIVDGFGIAGVEGVFRRCCEFTLQALREEKSGIMTLLNVLRYDPLYSWTVSPLRAKRMMDEKQDAVEGKKEEGPAEAERALAVVEKKLGRALSVKATVAELIQVAGDERNLAVLFAGWAAYS